ncbi:hypothetical protein [uncultured Phenylobacterium sp.]|uniref:hypothetical protein n=1 Tax=uncultured Phenylobacterium sp. TaxID=349273 RepID=UPI0025F51863|nr:hypothetical protein [uncultured Phenylobacterium sp.]
MRRALALAVTAAFVVTGVAQAETWTKFATMENGTDVSYDKDYTYRDKQSGRLVVMQALSKGNLGPSAPGKADSVGTVVAFDCSSKNMIAIASYRPDAPLEIDERWRSDKPKKVSGSDNEALLKAVCADSSKVPVR